MKKARTRNYGMFGKFVVLMLVLAFTLFAMPLAACGSDNGGNGGGGGGGGGDSDKPVPEGSLQVTAYYLRKDANYSGWDLYAWVNDNATPGVGHAFEKSTVTLAGHQFAKVTFTVKTTAKTDANKPIGIIVRKGGDSWAGKDPEGDRFVTADKFTDRKATIYLASGASPIYSDAQATVDAVMLNKITSAVFGSDRSSVFIKTDKAIGETSIFKVKDSDDNVLGTVNGSDFVDGTSATIELAAPIDITKTGYYVVDEPDGTFDKEINFQPAHYISRSAMYESDEFNADYGYDGVLGAQYAADKTTFSVWSPIATAMKLNIYNSGDAEETPKTTVMTKGDKAVWTAEETGDLAGKYYTYTVTTYGETHEVVDPYARSVGKNGARGMIIDLDTTDPVNWATQSNPTLASYSDAVIYEAQLRDLTIDESSNVSAANRGKYLGMTEKGAGDKKTPLDRIKELGVTAVHFQPLFDFASVKEDFTTATYDKAGEYNWGYDPLNYNAPEGSYSSNPSDGAKRITELKQMIMALHNEGIQVIMDVVYNHVSSLNNSNFQYLVPDYYFRLKDDGTPYSGSGCGNDTASENYMFRKFMIDSVSYWTQEYNVDGFRFDLMGLHDIETMNSIYDTLVKINDDVIVYGEGWDMDTGLGKTERATIFNADKMPNIAFFDDITRNGIKGGVFGVTDTGFATGNKGSEAAIYIGAAGGTSAIKDSVYKELGDDKEYFADSPTQNVNYISCHDNSTLWDRINASVKAEESVIKGMYRIAATANLTSQGVGFFLAGEELMRSKPTTKTNNFDNRPNPYKTDPNYYFSDNSYKSPDSVNAIKWNKADENADMVSYYAGLIALKKALPQLRISDTETLKSCFVYKDNRHSDGIAVYAVKDPKSDSYAVFVYNVNDKAKTVNIPNGTYDVHIKGAQASVTPIGDKYTGSTVEIAPYSAMLLVGDLTADIIEDWTYGVAKDEVAA